MKLKNSAQRVQNVLEQHNLSLTVKEFPDTTRTAQEAADVIGCQIGQIAKTLIFQTVHTNQPICIIASGKNRVDEKKVAHYIGQAIKKPDADFVLKHTGFAIGGIPPIGYNFEHKPLIDKDLLEYPELWAAAGTPFAVFTLIPENLALITQGQIVDIKK